MKQLDETLPEAIRLVALPVEQRKLALEQAAEALLSDYLNDPEMIIWSSLDSEAWHEHVEER